MDTNRSPEQPEFQIEIDPQPSDTALDSADLAYLLKISDALGKTLDLQTLLKRTAELVSSILPHRLFAIFLLNERSQELRIRFHTGHTSEATRLRIPMGKGIVGHVAQTRKPLLINNVAAAQHYIEAHSETCSELAVPLIAKNRLIGVMDLESDQLDYFRPEHLHLLTLTASRIAQAIENARLYARITRQAQTLVTLNEVAIELASILDLDPLFERMSQLLRRLIDFQMFSIMLLDENGENLITRYAWRFGYAHTPLRKLSINTGLVGAAVREWRLLNIPDVKQDQRYVVTNPETRSELIAPLFYKSRVIGVLDLEHTRPGFFTEEHQKILTTLAAQVAISIENARLYQTIRRHEAQLERDIAMARQVQLRLLPSAPPLLTNAELASRFVPARSIGGDLYDFLDYGPNQTAIVLGDVSGKAAPAALFAALASGLLRSEAQLRPAPGVMLATLNESLQVRKLESQFITMLFALWNDENRTLRVANSGAVPPFICRADSMETVKAEGFPLGLFAEANYEELTIAVDPGDLLVFVSDGILDAQNKAQKMYGEKRLIELLPSLRELSAGEIAAAILADVANFQGDRERFDDETIIVLRVR